MSNKKQNWMFLSSSSWLVSFTLTSLCLCPMHCGWKHTVFVMFVRVCVRACVRVCIPKKLLTLYVAEYLIIFTKLKSHSWDRDERFTIWGQKVKGQGHDGIKFAGSSTFWAC